MKVSVFPLLVSRRILYKVVNYVFFLARGMGELPSGPSGGAGGNDGGFGRRPGRFAEGPSASSAPVTIDQSRLPACAPYTAFIGNLPFDVAEADVRTFFQMRNIAANAILNVKLPRDSIENKPRGFGYVEFATIEDLTRALLSSNQFSIRNRVVRVDLSDSKPQTEREIRPAEANRNWRDGATPASASGNRMMPPGRVLEREPRPVSVAEGSHNWRDGAKPVEKTFVPAAVPSGASGEERRALRPAPVAAEPVRNWRESAKPVEKKEIPGVADAVVEEKPAERKFVRPAAEASKVPTGSWRK